EGGQGGPRTEDGEPRKDGDAVAQAVPARQLSRKCGGPARGIDRGDGDPHVLPAAVQDSDRFDATDALRREVRQSIEPAGFQNSDRLAARAAMVTRRFSVTRG